MICATFTFLFFFSFSDSTMITNHSIDRSDDSPLWFVIRTSPFPALGSPCSRLVRDKLVPSDIHVNSVSLSGVFFDHRALVSSQETKVRKLKIIVYN